MSDSADIARMLMYGFANGASAFGDQARWALGRGLLSGQKPPADYAGGLTANQYVGKNFPTKNEFDPSREGSDIYQSAPWEAQTLGALGAARPMQMAGGSELENLRRLLKGSNKPEPAVPPKEINPADALENLRRLLRENG